MYFVLYTYDNNIKILLQYIVVWNTYVIYTVICHSSRWWQIFCFDWPAAAPLLNNLPPWTLPSTACHHHRHLHHHHHPNQLRHPPVTHQQTVLFFHQWGGGEFQHQLSRISASSSVTASSSCQFQRHRQFQRRKSSTPRGGGWQPSRCSRALQSSGINLH